MRKAFSSDEWLIESKSINLFFFDPELFSEYPREKLSSPHEDNDIINKKSLTRIEKLELEISFYLEYINCTLLYFYAV